MRLSRPPPVETPAETDLADALGLTATGRRALVAYRETLLAPYDELAPQVVQRGCACIACECRRITDRARGVEADEGS